jgi:hypothetical protein
VRGSESKGKKKEQPCIKYFESHDLRLLQEQWSKFYSFDILFHPFRSASSTVLFPVLIKKVVGFSANHLTKRGIYSS